MLEVLHAYSKNKWKVFLKYTNYEIMMFGSVIWNKASRDITRCKHRKYFAVIYARRQIFLKGIQLTLSHICISVLVLYQHDYLETLLFPTLSNTFIVYQAS